MGRKFKVFTNVYGALIDPKNFSPNAFVDIEGDFCIIPPNSFALAETVEYFEIPRDILAICLGKSTYARCGIIVNVTPLEPEWRGKVTIEISNTTPLPAKIYANEGIAQILFFKTEAPCEKSYADKKGKYQDQKGLDAAVRDRRQEGLVRKSGGHVSPKRKRGNTASLRQEQLPRLRFGIAVQYPTQPPEIKLRCTAGGLFAN